MVDDATPTARDIRNDVNSLEFATPREMQTVTGIDKSAIERIGLLADFSCTLSGTFNPDANLSHDVLRTIPTSDTMRTVAMGIGGKTLSNECLGTDYNVSRGDNGALNWTAPFVLADGTVPAWA